MLNYKKSDVTIMIHIPYITLDYKEIMFDKLRELLDMCEIPFDNYVERWDLIKDTEKKTISEFFYAGDKTWMQKKRSMLQDLCFSLVIATMGEKRKFAPEVRIVATINRSETYTTPMKNDERTIRIDIDRAVWDKMNTDMLCDAVCNACFELNGTYACIDIDAYCPLSIYDGNFLLFAENRDKINVETQLPGIQWGQYVSANMTEATANLSTIVKEAPCYLSKAIHGSGVWLQATDSVWNVSTIMKQKMRQYFLESLPRLSLRAIAECNIPHMQCIIDSLPLTSFEKEEIEILRSTLSDDL